MSGLTDFYDPDFKRRVADTIRAIEQQTSAEVVVQVRRSAGRYKDADYLAGFSLALITLLVLLFAPRPFALVGFPVQTALAFLLGAGLSSRLPALRRVFASRRSIAWELDRSVRAAFVELGISRTSGRWGILVLVAAFERKVAVLTDIGIDVPALGDEWRSAREGLERAVADGAGERFLTALAGFGPILGRALPHRDDDVNELPDEVSEGAPE
jgi:putative membrane protein